MERRYLLCYIFASIHLATPSTSLRPRKGRKWEKSDNWPKNESDVEIGQEAAQAARNKVEDGLKGPPVWEAAGIPEQ